MVCAQLPLVQLLDIGDRDRQVVGRLPIIHSAAASRTSMITLSGNVSMSSCLSLSMSLSAGQNSWRSERYTYKICRS